MKKGRMTYLDIRMIVEEIEAWGKRERGQKLSWAILERIFPFTRQTMYSKNEVRTAYAKAKISLNSGLNSPPRGESNINDLEVVRLKNRIKELEIQIEGFQKLWVETKFKT